jgi:hypothetical protein
MTLCGLAQTYAATHSTHTQTQEMCAQQQHTHTKEKCAHTFLLNKQHTNSRYPEPSETLTMKQAINSLVYLWISGI